MAAKKRSQSAFSYLRLLVAVSPKPLDFFLLGFGTLASIAAGVPFPIMSVLFGQLVDQLNGASCANEQQATNSHEKTIATKVLLTVYIAVANFILIYVATGSWTIFGERLVRRLRYAYLESLLKQEVAFFETYPAGEVAASLDDGLATIQAGVSEKVGIVIQTISYFCTSCIVSFSLDAPLAGMLMSLIPAFMLMTILGGHFSKKYSSQVQERLAPAISMASESISNIQLIKAFHASKKIEALFVTHLATTHRPAMGKLLTAAIQMGLLYFIGYSANAISISQGGRQVADSIASRSNAATLGAVYTVMMTLLDASYVISRVAPFATIFASASGAAENILDTIHRKPKIDSSKDSSGLVLPKVEGKVEFRDVVFHYPSRPEVMVHDELSLTIPAGKMTGIVGGSGSGKSTIAALTQRFYDPDEGNVLLDGHDVRDIQLQSLRGHIGYVEQNPVLFDRSIMENIAHGLVGSSRLEHRPFHRLLVSGELSFLAHDVVKGGNIDSLAARSSQLPELLSMIRMASTQAGLDNCLIDLPLGLATSVGTGGSHLSGGQKQRVALARALIRQPSILILDEATAALDSSTEAQIMESIHNLPGERTVICVTHRLSTIKNADNILVMGPRGRIIEQGSYAMLLASSGVFASMVQSQTIIASEESEAKALKAQKPSCSDNAVSLSNNEKQVAIISGAPDKEASLREAKTTVKPEAEMSTFSIFFYLMKIDRMRHRIASIVGLVASIIVGGSHAGEAVIFGNAVANLAFCRSPPDIRRSASLYGLLFFLLAVLEFFANSLSGACFGYVSHRLVNSIRKHTFRSLLRRDLQWHETEDKTHGALISYFTADAAAMSGLTGTILGVSVSVLVTLLAGVILGNIVAWKISLVLTACIPLIFGSGFLRLRLHARFAARHAKAFSNSVSTATESVSQIKTVSAFSLQEEVLNTFHRSLAGPYKATLKSIAFGNLWLAAAFSIGSLVNALAYWWGGQLISRGEITQVAFFISLTSLLSAAQISGQFFGLSPDISKAVVAARRVFDLICPDGKPDRLRLEQPPLFDSEKSIVPCSGVAGSEVGVAVSLQSVDFYYSNSPHSLILRNFSLDIPAGSFVAFVGTSGAGKSTILSLVGGLYKPTGGKVTLDGYDISRHRQNADARESLAHDVEDDEYLLPIWNDIAFVPQDPTLFSGSLTFNIDLGSRDGRIASPAEIEDAARLANIHDTIKDLPKAYETLCGPSGSQVFSGGQKQRLCIARALIRNPRLLLLDEPSSAMDPKSESLFEKTLEGLMQPNDGGKRRVTVVTIAHRLRTVMKADKIFVIEHGQILDAGTHNELAARCAKYREDVLHQALT